MAMTDPDGATPDDRSTELVPPPGDVPDEILGPGDLVGRFIVHRILGMGGAGVVYAAHDPELDRTIALKILRRELTERGDARARFLREAQALARLSHPNVISVYDVGAAEGRVFIAMEYIHGQTFADWVARSDPSWLEIVAVLVKAGRGLSAAHAAGLIHRDFKPANLLVGVDGRVVVTDFGLARAVMEADAEADSSAARALPRSSAFADSITRTGATQGTPAYMAPEQHQGQPADARADQFSFCVTLHEALYREHPFLPLSSSLSESVARADRHSRGPRVAPAHGSARAPMEAGGPLSQHGRPPDRADPRAGQAPASVAAGAGCGDRGADRRWAGGRLRGMGRARGGKLHRRGRAASFGVEPRRCRPRCGPRSRPRLVPTRGRAPTELRSSSTPAAASGRPCIGPPAWRPPAASNRRTCSIAAWCA